MTARDLLQRLRALFRFSTVRSAGHDIFISYRREPVAKTYANALRGALEARGKRCFFDDHSLATGDDIERLKKEARRSRMFLLVGTKSIFESVHIPAELGAYDEAHRGWIKRRLRRILPINIRRALTPYEMPTEELKNSPGPWKPLLGLVTEPESDGAFDSGTPSPDVVIRIDQSSGLVNSTQIMLAIMAAIALSIAGLALATLYFGNSVVEGQKELTALEETRKKAAEENKKLVAEQTRLEEERTRLECDLAEREWKLAQVAKDLEDATQETARQQGLAEEATLRATLQRGEAYVSEGHSLFNQGRYELAKQQFDAASKIATTTRTPNFAADVGVSEVYRQRPPSLWTLEAHAGGVNALEFSPDGRFLLTGGTAVAKDDAVLVAWDARSGQKLHEFTGHGPGLRSQAAAVLDVAFSPDGKMIASAGTDGTARVWDFWSAEEKHPHEKLPFMSSKDIVTAVAFTSDGKALAAGGLEGVFVLDRHGKTRVDTSGQVQGIALGGTDDQYLAVSTPEKIYLFNRLGTTSPVWTLDGHKRTNRRVAFAGGRIAVASALGTVGAWDLKTNRIVGTGTAAMTPLNAARGVAMTPDGKQLFYATRDNDLVRILVDTSDVLQRYFHEHSGPVTDIAISPAEPLIASASTDGTVRVWPVGSDLQRTSFEGHRYSITALDLAAHDRLLLAASHDGLMVIHDADTLLPLASLWAEEVGGALLLPDGTSVFVAGWTDLGIDTPPAFEHRKEVLSSANLGIRRRDMPDSWFPVSHPIIRSADGRWMLCRESATAVVRRVGEDVPRGQLQMGSPITAMALSRDGGKVVLGAEDGTLRIWLLHDGYPADERTLRFSHKGDVAAVAFLADGMHAVSCGKDGTIRSFDLSTSAPPSIIEGSILPLRSCAVHPGGRWLAASSDDGSVRLWDLKNGTQVANLYHGEERRIDNLVFDATGDRLFASVSAAGPNGGLFWNFSRAAEYRRLQAQLPAALANDRKHSRDAAHQRVLGEWYALRGMWSWASAYLEEARKRGASIPHETLARVYHHLGRKAEARREMQAALDSGETDHAYGQLFLAALGDAPAAGAASAQRPSAKP